jgi:hypothetical protein
MHPNQHARPGLFCLAKIAGRVWLCFNVKPKNPVRILSSALTPVSKFVAPGLFVVLPLSSVLSTPTQSFAWIFAIVWFGIGAVVLWWWALPIKKVSLMGNHLRISNYWREIDVPVSQIAKIRGSRWNRAPNVTLSFDPPTPFGRKIRIVVPLDMDVERVIALLDGAMATPPANEA